VTCAEATVLVNGRPGGVVEVLERGLHFGDGLFETIACLKGRARFLSLHLERLQQGCGRLRIGFEGWGLLRTEVEAMAAGAAGPAILKLLLSRGPATARGYAARGDEVATRILLRQPWPADDPALGREGINARIGTLRLGENPALAGMKHLNRLEQVLARAEWQAQDIHESLLFSSSGRLISGTMTNVFLVRNGGLLTPRLDRCGVQGVMRRVIMREAREAGLSMRETELFAADLAVAEEVFLTNARVGLWPVRTLDGRQLGGPGPVTRRLQARLGPLLETPVDA